jgi:hypothetical protein
VVWAALLAAIVEGKGGGGSTWWAKIGGHSGAWDVLWTHQHNTTDNSTMWMGEGKGHADTGSTKMEVVVELQFALIAALSPVVLHILETIAKS